MLLAQHLLAVRGADVFTVQDTETKLRGPNTNTAVIANSHAANDECLSCGVRRGLRRGLRYRLCPVMDKYCQTFDVIPKGDDVVRDVPTAPLTAGLQVIYGIEVPSVFP